MKMRLFWLLSLCLSSVLGASVYHDILRNDINTYDDVMYRDQQDPTNYVTVCENKQRDITCDPGRIVRIMEADFGRRDSTTCAGANPNKRCFTTFATQVVASKCYRKQSCTVDASTQTFGYPPGCSDTDKYLFVRYQCERAAGL